MNFLHQVLHHLGGRQSVDHAAVGDAGKEDHSLESYCHFIIIGAAGDVGLG